MTLDGFTPGTYTYSCDFASGGDASFTLTESTDPQTFDNGATCYDAVAGDKVWVTIGSVTSNAITVGSGSSGGSGGSTTGTIAIGWSTAHPTWITMTLDGFTPGTYTYSCDFASGGDASFTLTESTDPQTFDNGATCYDALAGDKVWVTIGSVTSNTITVGSGSSGGSGGSTTGTIAIGWSTAHPTWITMTLDGFTPGTYTYSCDFASGGDASFTLTESTDPQTFDNGATCYDAVAGDKVWVTIGSVTSNAITVGSGSTSTTTWAETAGGVAHTWTNYSDAGGTEGPSIAAYQTVQITCRTTGFRVADGNTWWYKIASSPWSNSYWVSADAFYNNGRTSGSLAGTPFYDPNVSVC